MNLKTEPSNAIINSYQISDHEFQLFATMVYDRFGIHLTEQKMSLVSGRLQKKLRELSLSSFKEYYEYIIHDKSQQSLIELINLLTTNHTFFFREKTHFDFFIHQALPELKSQLISNNLRDLRIWSAGCSSGEEPYTLVMLLMEFLGTDYSHWDAGLLATDISEKVLSFAKIGIYPEDRVKDLPPLYKQKYLQKLPNHQWEVIAKIKNEVTFRRFNLMNQQFPFKKQFHMIFCRNVMIYFDPPTRHELVQRFYQHLAPGGYLFIGHSETLGRENNLFEYIKPALYRKRV